MPKIRISTIREMSPIKRAERLTELRIELIRIKTMANAGGAIENPYKIREVRHAIAKILTVIKEDELRGKRNEI